MTSSSNNILQNCLNETSMVSVPVSSNMVIGSTTVPIQNELSSNISFDGFKQPKPTRTLLVLARSSREMHAPSMSDTCTPCARERAFMHFRNFLLGSF
ncbi:unnamed protein product [Rotaria magnacalcarata]|uniref:Uncharacterized protein n=1 Tax=Rotaria magnacalcarata TaxID=392030 RepID=A0A814Z5W6_9BILA|nr:unnamed protein product [Rotaria magnacalcarata]CAF2079523.1 unnamed protein product [Rotaria magnacalcarata]CAF5070225.1 unnamed protein product [Rotaria magnacalcarata]CAF5189583.1 unnamed protein product [Rotaria magnacalcarata]